MKVLTPNSAYEIHKKKINKIKEDIEKKRQKKLIHMANNPLANAISFTAPISQGGFHVLTEPTSAQAPISAEGRLNNSPTPLGSDSKGHVLNISDPTNYE
jgi:hypothetical protein